MIVFFVKFVFFAIDVLTNLVSRLIFSTTAYLLVLIFQAFRVPSQAIHGALEQVAEVVKGVFEYIFGLIMEAISSLISSAFDLVLEAISGSVSATGSAVGGLAEKTRTSLDGLLKNNLSDLAEEFSGLVSNILSNLWKNCVEAVGYVTENA